MSAKQETANEVSRQGQWGVLLLALVVWMLHAGTVRPGHTWWGMDDFTAYLLHGRNLMAGDAYGDIDTVADPDLPPVFQRTAFPPVFSLVVGLLDKGLTRKPTEALASPGRVSVEPTVAPRPPPPEEIERERDPLRGSDGLPLVPVKRVLALFTALAVIMVWRTLRHSARGLVLGATVVTFAFSPYLFAFRELVRSEMLFLMLLYLWMDQAERLRLSEQRGKLDIWGAVICGLTLWLAYATRTAAIVMPPALVVADLWRDRKIRRSSLIVLAVGVAAVFIQRAAYSSVEGGYMGKALAEWHFGTLVENVEQLSWNYLRLWDNGVSDVGRLVMGYGTLLLAGVGFFARMHRLALVDIFGLGYLAMIVLLPTDSAWMRYLLPLMPLGLLYTYTGIAVLAGAAASRRKLAFGGAGLAVLLTYGSAYAHLEYGPLPDGLDAPETLEVYDWVSDNTHPDDVIVFSKWRSMTLATGRPSLAYPQPYRHGDLEDEEIRAHFERMAPVAFVLKHTPPTPSNLFRMLSHSDRGFLDGYVERHPEDFDEVLRNDEFCVLRYRPVTGGR